MDLMICLLQMMLTREIRSWMMDVLTETWNNHEKRLKSALWEHEHDYFLFLSFQLVPHWIGVFDTQMDVN